MNEIEPVGSLINRLKKSVASAPRTPSPMTPKSRIPFILCGALAGAGIVALIVSNQRPSAPVAPVVPGPSAEKAAAPEPASAAPGTAEVSPGKMDAAAWMSRFRKLYGLPRAKLSEALAAMGYPLRDRTLERLVKTSRTEEEFAEKLLRELMLFHPNRLVTDAIQRGLSATDVAGLVMKISQSWQQTRLEGWTPHRGVIEMIRTEYASEGLLQKLADSFRRPYGTDIAADPLVLGAKLLEIPPEQRKPEQVMSLALDWPPERAHEMAAWGAAHLQGKEREEFFKRIAYPAYAISDPDLAQHLLDGISEPADRALVAPMVAATLMQHDRVEEALALLSELDGAARGETVKMAAKHWALRDADEAIAWVNDLAPGDFNVAIGAMFEHLPAATMRTALDGFARQQPDASQDAAVLRGLSRTTSWTDTATAAEVIPGYYAARGFAPLAAPSSEMWKGTPEQQSAALQFDVAARTVWSLSQKQGGAAALAWADRMQFATPDDKLIAQAYALPETVEIYSKNGVLGPIRGWIATQLADPAKRADMEQRLAQMRSQAPR